MSLTTTNTTPESTKDISSNSSYIFCLVCHDKIEVKVDDLEEVDEIYAEKLCCLYWTWLGSMNLKVDTDDFDFEKEHFPFCKSCTKSLVKIVKIYRNLSKISRSTHKLIHNIIAELSYKLINSHHSMDHAEELTQCLREDVPNNESQDKDNYFTLLSNTRRKVDIVRQTVYNAFNVTVSIERLSNNAALVVDDQSHFVHNEMIRDSEEVELLTATPHNEIDDDDDHDDVIYHSSDEDSGSPDELVLSSGSDDEFDNLLPSSDDDNGGATKKKVNFRPKIKLTTSKKPKYHTKEKVKRRTPKSTEQKLKVTSQPMKTKKGKTPCKVVTIETDKSRNYEKFLYDDKYAFERYGEEYRCCCCPKYKGQTRKNVVQHVRSLHAYIGKFQCDVCSRTFNRLREKQMHEASHIEGTPFLCDHCGQGFKSMDLLNIHSKLVHEVNGPWKHKCTFCGEKFRYVKKLLQHERVKHTGEKPFKCPICGKDFALKDSQLRHTRDHSASYLTLCHLCPSSFTRSSHLKTHIDRCHNPDKSPRRGYTKKHSRWTRMRTDLPTLQNRRSPPPPSDNFSTSAPATEQIFLQSSTAIAYDKDVCF